MPVVKKLILLGFMQQPLKNIALFLCILKNFAPLWCVFELIQKRLQAFIDAKFFYWLNRKKKWYRKYVWLKK
jgi:hypothetical protein